MPTRSRSPQPYRWVQGEGGGLQQMEDTSFVGAEMLVDARRRWVERQWSTAHWTSKIRHPLTCQVHVTHNLAQLKGTDCIFCVTCMEMTRQSVRRALIAPCPQAPHTLTAYKLRALRRLQRGEFPYRQAQGNGAVGFNRDDHRLVHEPNPIQEYRLANGFD
jgi:hypothetical protein